MYLCINLLDPDVTCFQSRNNCGARVCVTELQDHALIEEDGLEGELWAKPLAQLWQNRPYNEQREREYNREMGLQSPYCAICMIFQTHQRVWK